MEPMNEMMLARQELVLTPKDLERDVFLDVLVVEQAWSPPTDQSLGNNTSKSLPCRHKTQDQSAQ
jgi:hypothetical protein